MARAGAVLAGFGDAVEKVETSGVRVSPAVGVSKSIGLFFVYFILSGIATPLGGSGILDPAWAAIMPNLTMIGLATYFFGRMR